MAAPSPVAVEQAAPPRWGMGDAAAGWLIAYGATIVIGALILAALGLVDEGEHGRLPLYAIGLLQVPLWLGFIGVPLWAAATKGRGWVQDFRGRGRWMDVPLGFAGGLFAQLVLVPLVSWPWLALRNEDLAELEKPARGLADKATSTPGIVLFALIVAIGAPLAEELFFRGLLLRSLEKRWSLAVAVVGSSVLFGATHLQLLQLPALIAAGAVFGLLAARTGRLGPAVVAHMTFNATTVVALLASR